MYAWTNIHPTPSSNRTRLVNNTRRNFEHTMSCRLQFWMMCFLKCSGQKRKMISSIDTINKRIEKQTLPDIITEIIASPCYHLCPAPHFFRSHKFEVWLHMGCIADSTRLAQVIGSWSSHQSGSRFSEYIYLEFISRVPQIDIFQIWDIFFKIQL